MSDSILFGSLIAGLFGVTLVYIRLAEAFSIIDQPNAQSVYQVPTVRGAGILFPIAWLAWFLWSGGLLPWVTLGVLMLGVAGFIDDLRGLGLFWRLGAQVLAFLLLWAELNGFSLPVSWFLVALLVGVGAINAVNFMDGINGMMGLYALSILLPLQAYYAPYWAAPTPWAFLIAALLVFGFFNFRKKARCFAGDVGSLTLGYLLVFYVGAMVLGRSPLDPGRAVALAPALPYLLLLALYGVDSVLTILQRIHQRESIFTPHRQHLYQMLANERRWPQLWVSGAYAALQAGLCGWVLWRPPSTALAFLAFVVLALGYLNIKNQLYALDTRTDTP